MLVRLGDPRVVPCFHCMFLLDMSPSTTPGSSSAAHTQFLADNIGLRHRLTGSALPSTPPSASGGFWYFVASLVRIATTCRVARLPWRIRPGISRPTEAFTPGLPSGRSPSPTPGITTVVTGQSPPAGLSPAGTAASIAALSDTRCSTYLIFTAFFASRGSGVRIPSRPPNFRELTIVIFAKRSPFFFSDGIGPRKAFRKDMRENGREKSLGKSFS